MGSKPTARRLSVREIIPDDPVGLILLRSGLREERRPLMKKHPVHRPSASPPDGRLYVARPRSHVAQLLALHLLTGHSPHRSASRVES